MTVGDVMTKSVVTCTPETSLATAGALMEKNGCGALPVVAETGRLLGILTDRDICIALGTRNARASDLRAGDLIHDNTFVSKASDDIEVALQRMRRGGVRRLPVVNGDALLEGILSIDDIVLRATADGGNGISYGEVVNTLQAIYACDRRADQRSVAA